jgi:hypothetical protein
MRWDFIIMMGLKGTPSLSACKNWGGTTPVTAVFGRLVRKRGFLKEKNSLTLHELSGVLVWHTVCPVLQRGTDFLIITHGTEDNCRFILVSWKYSEVGSYP